MWVLYHLKKGDTHLEKVTISFIFSLPSNRLTLVPG